MMSRSMQVNNVDAYACPFKKRLKSCEFNNNLKTERVVAVRACNDKLFHTSMHLLK